MKSGIAPRLLVEQVKSTASWLWNTEHPATRALDDVAAAEADQSSSGPAYLVLLLAAHYATVATFVPTDVDARIRHHAWMAIDSVDALGAACDVVDVVASWRADAVSARVHDGTLSGHDGEWLAVRAGALGRAAHLGAGVLATRLTEAIDAEVDREETLFRAALDSGNVRRILEIATIVAHNLGDLSRVVSEWPAANALLEERGRWLRLGHPDAPSRRPALVTAGALNKALVAHENHRFLALRKARGLRASRDLLLPIGPWLDRWGSAIAKSSALEDRDRADVLAALLEIHGQRPDQEGCLRAIAGLHHATAGGIERFVPDLPARLRKDALRGKVRDVLDVSEERFDARLERRYEQARASIR